MVNVPQGYLFGAVYAGIRKKQRDDLALIVSDRPASAAGVFTRNQVQAACIRLNKRYLAISGGSAQAVLINAGNANCATPTEDKVAVATTEAVALQLGLPVERVLAASTGVIGQDLNPSLVTAALPRLVERLRPDGLHEVAGAIMTTDTRPKTAHREVSLRRGTIRLSGITKGAGMIHPNMATTLCFVVTDAAVSSKTLQTMLRRANDRSYNRLSVDGDTSTNDMILVLANGAAGVKPAAGDLGRIEEALTSILQDLARQIARDGEGARKLITIQVSGARTEEDAVRIARSIANSPLVKTAIAGADANWGRIICAAGYSGIEFDARKVDIQLQDLLVCRSGLFHPFSEEDMRKRLEKDEVTIDLKIQGRGKGQATFWTCDFTEEYIRINADYRT